MILAGTPTASLYGGTSVFTTARASGRTFAYRNRRHQHGVGTDESSFADLRLVLTRPIEIAGNETRTEISVCPTSASPT